MTQWSVVDGPHVQQWQVGGCFLDPQAIKHAPSTAELAFEASVGTPQRCAPRHSSSTCTPGAHVSACNVPGVKDRHEPAQTDHGANLMQDPSGEETGNAAPAGLRETDMAAAEKETACPYGRGTAAEGDIAVACDGNITCNLPSCRYHQNPVLANLVREAFNMYADETGTMAASDVREALIAAAGLPDEANIDVTESSSAGGGGGRYEYDAFFRMVIRLVVNRTHATAESMQ